MVLVPDPQIFAAHGGTATDVGLRDMETNRFLIGFQFECVESLQLFLFAASLRSGIGIGTVFGDERLKLLSFHFGSRIDPFIVFAPLCLVSDVDFDIGREEGQLPA